MVARTKASATALLAMLLILNIYAFAPTIHTSRVTSRSFDLPRINDHGSFSVRRTTFCFHEKKKWNHQMNANRNSLEEYDTEEECAQSKFLAGRQEGNYLDVLALSVIIFFLATTWLSNGKLFSEFSSTYDNLGAKTSVYKYVDADRVLQEDFTRETSSVTF